MIKRKPDFSHLPTVVAIVKEYLAVGGNSIRKIPKQNRWRSTCSEQDLSPAYLKYFARQVYLEHGPWS